MMKLEYHQERLKYKITYLTKTYVTNTIHLGHFLAYMSCYSFYYYVCIIMLNEKIVYRKKW